MEWLGAAANVAVLILIGAIVLVIMIVLMMKARWRIPVIVYTGPYNFVQTKARVYKDKTSGALMMRIKKYPLVGELPAPKEGEYVWSGRKKWLIRSYYNNRIVPSLIEWKDGTAMTQIVDAEMELWASSIMERKRNAYQNRDRMILLQYLGIALLIAAFIVSVVLVMKFVNENTAMTIQQIQETNSILERLVGAIGGAAP